MGDQGNYRMNMQPSDKAYALIKAWESFRPTAYKPTKFDIWTIGWGHTVGVKEGDTCDYATAQAWLVQDTADAVGMVNCNVKVPLTQNQFDACVSFAFNIELPFTSGHGFITKLNAGDYTGAADEMLKWDTQKGRVIDGLEHRRKAERALFLSP